AQVGFLRTRTPRLPVSWQEEILRKYPPKQNARRPLRPRRMHTDCRPSPRRLFALVLTLTVTFTRLSLLLPARPARHSASSADETKPALSALEIRPGDHICLIGNTLADRMQHDGWLETYFQSRFPEHKLVFRNLGFSGDELTLRLRSMDFGTPDQWLAG